jgi:hypothetical protein
MGDAVVAAVASRVPSGENARARSGMACPCIVLSSPQSSTSHVRKMPSSPPPAISDASGAIATLSTGVVHPVAVPCRSSFADPVSIRQTLTDLSASPITKYVSVPCVPMAAAVIPASVGMSAKRTSVMTSHFVTLPSAGATQIV